MFTYDGDETLTDEVEEEPEPPEPIETKTGTTVIPEVVPI